MPRHMHSLWQQGDACVAPTEPLCAAPACQLWNVHACEGTRPSSTLGLFPPPFIACGSDARAARRAATSLPVIPAERAGLRPASESRNPVIKAVRAFTPAVDYWVPARARPVEPGSLGRDDSPYAIALPCRGTYCGVCCTAKEGEACLAPTRHKFVVPTSSRRTGR